MADDDDVKLSSSALAALQEFLAEQKEATKAAKENPFAENWALSQASRLSGALSLSSVLSAVSSAAGRAPSSRGDEPPRAACSQNNVTP